MNEHLCNVYLEALKAKYDCCLRIHKWDNFKPDVELEKLNLDASNFDLQEEEAKYILDAFAVWYLGIPF